MNKCKIYQKCGGCKLLHLDYEQTLALKKEKVENCFKQEKIKVEIEAVHGAKNFFQYRNKMQLAFKFQNGKTVCGFYEENTHKVINLDTCLIHTENQNALAVGIRDIVISLQLKPYDEDRKTGLLRHILIKEGFTTKEVMVVIVTATEMFPARSEFVKRIRAQFPFVTTIIQNINPRKTSIVLGEKERVLLGKGYIEDYLWDFKFRITSKSFFQVNPEQTKRLYQTVKDYAGLTGKETVIDAYSGVGTIGMVLSREAKEVISVESNKQAVLAAISNAKENNIKNMKFYCDDATLFLTALAKENFMMDVVIMDPPRSGSTPEFLASIKKLKPKKVVYVSCEPSTLARDLKSLLQDYRLVKTSIVDMFCWTEHVETVVLITRV